MLHVKNYMSELISNYIAIHQQHLDVISKAKEDHHENMAHLYHQHLDTSIEQLESFHSKLEEDGNTKSEISSALIKAAIDHRRHFKSTLTHRKNGVDIHKENIKRLAMGVFAVLGLSTLSINSTKAAFQASKQSTIPFPCGNSIQCSDPSNPCWANRLKPWRYSQFTNYTT